MNGVEHMDQVAPSALMRSTASFTAKSCMSTERPPSSIGAMRPWKKPTAWFRGAGIHMTSSEVRSRPSTKTRSENRMLLWVSMTSLGLPVVPEVESRHATWSDSTGTFSAKGSVVLTISATVGRSECLGAFLSTSAMTLSVGMSPAISRICCS